MYKNFMDEVVESSKGQLTPDTAKSVPENRVDTMMEWLLNPTTQVPEKELEKPAETTQPLGEKLTEGEKKALERYREKVAIIAKAREAKSGTAS